MAEDAVTTGGRRALTRRQAALDVSLAILLIPTSAVAAGVLAMWLSPGPPNLMLVVVVQALLSLAGVSALLSWRGERFRDIGLQPLERRDATRALLVLLTAFGANTALTIVIYAVAPEVLQAHLEGLRSIALELTSDAPLVGALALLLLVGFYEEIVARGLLLARSRSLLRGAALPVIFSSLLFGLGHFYQGLYGTVQTAVLGVVLAAYTLRWRTLWPAIIAHAVINMLSVAALDGIPELPELP